MRAEDGFSERFLTRALLGALPTYSTMAKRIHGGEDWSNNTARMYIPEGGTDPIVDSKGTCILCGLSPETIEHVMCECEGDPKMVHIRQQRKQSAEAIAHEHGVLRWWRGADWTTTSCREDQTWERTWGCLGMPPKEVWASLQDAGVGERGATRILHDLQDVMAATAAQLWDRRNKMVKAEEKCRGVTVTGDTGQSTCTQDKETRPKKTGKRGRPKLPLSSLAESTKAARRRHEDKAKLDDTHPEECEMKKRDRGEMRAARAAEERRAKEGDQIEVGAQGVGVNPATKGMGRPRPNRDRHMARSQGLGVGSRLKVLWPGNTKERGRKWEGTVVAVIPTSSASWDHILEYEGSLGQYFRHSLWAGETTYEVLHEECHDHARMCHQGTGGGCDCSAHEGTHHHPWYIKDTAIRAPCDCTFCTHGTPNDQTKKIISAATDAGAPLPLGSTYMQEGAPNRARRPKKKREEDLMWGDPREARRRKAESDKARAQRCAKRARDKGGLDELTGRPGSDESTQGKLAKSDGKPKAQMEEGRLLSLENETPPSTRETTQPAEAQSEEGARGVLDNQGDSGQPLEPGNTVPPGEKEPPRRPTTRKRGHTGDTDTMESDRPAQRRARPPAERRKKTKRTSPLTHEEQFQLMEAKKIKRLNNTRLQNAMTRQASAAHGRPPEEGNCNNTQSNKETVN